MAQQQPTMTYHTATDGVDRHEAHPVPHIAPEDAPPAYSPYVAKPTNQPSNIVYEESSDDCCCGCLDVATGAMIIMSLYLTIGVVMSGSSFAFQAYDSIQIHRILTCIVGALYAIAAFTGGFGLYAALYRKKTAMSRISILFWLLTVLIVMLCVAKLSVAFTFRERAIEDCVSQGVNGWYTFVDRWFVRHAVRTTLNAPECQRWIQHSLFREVFKLLFIQGFQVYFAFVIHRYAQELQKSAQPISTEAMVQQIDVMPPTYVIYMQPPPNAPQWAPPRAPAANLHGDRPV